MLMTCWLPPMMRRKEMSFFESSWGSGKGFILILVYVDDLLVASHDEKEGDEFLRKLMVIWKIKLTGKISALKKGVLQFLGRTIYRERDGESSLSSGVSEAYMVGIMDSWHEKLKPTEVPPKLEDLDLVKSKEKEGEVALTQEGEVRYRRVLGQLAWAALSRADLCFYVSFLARYQSKPHAAAEACLRAVLRWLLTRLHRVQVPALSSAEAELYSLVENAKELIAVALLLETILAGIELDALLQNIASATWNMEKAMGKLVESIDKQNIQSAERDKQVGDQLLALQGQVADAFARMTSMRMKHCARTRATCGVTMVAFVACSRAFTVFVAVIHYEG
eukprot:s2638_g1.t1